MRRRRRGWRLRIWFWVGAGLCVLNAALLSTYRGVYAGRFQALEDEIAQVQNLRTRATQEVARREDQVTTVEATRSHVRTLYRDGFATERERLTDLIGRSRNWPTARDSVPARSPTPRRPWSSTVWSRSRSSSRSKGTTASCGAWSTCSKSRTPSWPSSRSA